MNRVEANNLSLDDIIKKKNIGRRNNNFGRKNNANFAKITSRLGGIGIGNAPPKIVDARNKIIQKNRSKIRDARDKLHQISKVSDARLRIMKKRKGPISSNNLNLRMNRGPPIQQQQHASHQSKQQPIRREQQHKRSEIYDNNFNDFDNTINMSEGEFSLRRTVKNDIALPMPSSIPPFPSFGAGRSVGRSPSFWTSDPFDCYEVPVRRPMEVPEPVHLQRKIFNVSSGGHSTDMPRKGILRHPRLMSPPHDQRSRFNADENSSLSYEMRARLERSPDPHESSGIFSRTSSQPVSISSGFRIVVSNLHASVSQGDIKELFEDIGELLEARLVRPGVAEVIFKHLRHAEEAVDTYHNRHLDGQPMKCLLVKPRSSGKPTAPAIKTTTSVSSSKTNKNHPVEIDIDALHSVLFRRS